jgi:hypothetical protein
MFHYRDSIHDPYNDVGSDAHLRAAFVLEPVVDAAIRGGLPPEALIGQVAAILAPRVDQWEPAVLTSLKESVSEFFDTEVACGVSVVEATGFILGAVMDCALRTSLELRFEAPAK